MATATVIVRRPSAAVRASAFLVVLGLALGWWVATLFAPQLAAGQWWQHLFPQKAHEVTQFRSAPAMAEQSQLIVVARIADVRFSRALGDASDQVPYAVLDMEVQDVLAGDAPPGRLLVEVLLSRAEQVDELRAAAVGTEGLFFVRNKGDELHSLGASEAEVATNDPYYRFESSQGVWVRQTDRVQIAEWVVQEWPFLREWVGRPFESAREAMREMARERADT